MRLSYVFLFTIMFGSCSDIDIINQSYNNFNEFNQATLRQKTWFPNIIAADCYNFKEIRHLGNNNSYGMFAYKNRHRMDSLLSDTTNFKKTTKDALNNFLNKITTPKRPNWFIDIEHSNNIEFYMKENKYLIQDKKTNKIYFFYSSII